MEVQWSRAGPNAPGAARELVATRWVVFLRRLFRLIPPDPFTEGLQCMDRGQLRRAIDAFAPLLGSADEGVRGMARLYSCESWLQLGDEIAPDDPRAALPCYENASELQPDFADVQHRLGRTRLRLEDHAAAIVALRRALDINARFFNARLDLIEAIVRGGRDHELEAEVQALAANAPDFFDDEIAELRQAAQVGNYEAVCARVDSIRDHNPSPRERLRREALRALRDDRPADALAALAELLDTGSRYPDFLQLQGLAHARLGDGRAAEDSFREALAIHPGYTKARVNLALSLMDQDRMAEAERELRRVLEQDPSHPLAQSALEEIHGLAVED